MVHLSIKAVIEVVIQTQQLKIILYKLRAGFGVDRECEFMLLLHKQAKKKVPIESTSSPNLTYFK